MSDAPSPWVGWSKPPPSPEFPADTLSSSYPRWAQSTGDTVKVATPWYMRLLVGIGPGVRWFPIHIDYFDHFCDSLLRDAGMQPADSYIPGR